MLEERGWRGTFNIVTDWIGKNEKFLTWEDVRELIRRGHEVTRLKTEDARRGTTRRETEEIRLEG